MNAALLLSPILIMAPVTVLINTITSDWKSLRKTLSCCCVQGSVYNTDCKFCRLSGRRAAMARGCDFVLHHCPCLMDAWLFLSSCCDNVKCCIYERAKRVFPYCQHPLKHTHVHTQTACTVLCNLNLFAPCSH